MSPLISNLVFLETDIALKEKSQALGLSYSRYADDLVFSGVITDSIVNELMSEIRAFDWKINNSKTRFMRRGHSQYVTGLSVSDDCQPHAPRRLKRFLRFRQYIFKKYGKENYIERFGSDFDRLIGLQNYAAGVDPSFKQQKIKDNS